VPAVETVVGDWNLHRAVEVQFLVDQPEVFSAIIAGQNLFDNLIVDISDFIGDSEFWAFVSIGGVFVFPG
jgi:hypothetical protein